MTLFKIVVETGSFAQATNQLYLTRTAVRKQMNQLEKTLGVKLFMRNNQGVSLNPAGQFLYTETLRIMHESEKVLNKVRELYYNSPTVLRVGPSNLYPSYHFMDLWAKISPRMPKWQLKIVPLIDDKDYLAQLGKSYDLIVGPFAIDVPYDNPLARQKSVSLTDLDGQSLMIIKKGISLDNDFIRQTITKQYPQVNLIDIEPRYSLETFNRCVETGALLLSLDCWERIHPELKSVQLKEKFAILYGLVYLSNSVVMKNYVSELSQLRR